MLLALLLALTACSTKEQVLRGQFMWEFERREFLECGTGKLFTVRDTGYMAAHKDAPVVRSGGFVEVRGRVTQPGMLGSVGVTSGVVTVKSFSAVSPDEARCSRDAARPKS